MLILCCCASCCLWCLQEDLEKARSDLVRSEEEVSRLREVAASAPPHTAMSFSDEDGEAGRSGNACFGLHACYPLWAVALHLFAPLRDGPAFSHFPPAVQLLCFKPVCRHSPTNPRCLTVSWTGCWPFPAR
jgi:hypothetical protein